jgi:hypothetical protein
MSPPTQPTIQPQFPTSSRIIIGLEEANIGMDTPNSSNPASDAEPYQDQTHDLLDEDEEADVRSFLSSLLPFSSYPLALALLTPTRNIESSSRTIPTIFLSTASRPSPTAAAAHWSEGSTKVVHGS